MDIDRLWHALSPELRAGCVKPYVPSAYSFIAKLQAPYAFLDALSFDFRSCLSQWSGVEYADPEWVAVERSAEAGARKRRCKEVAARDNGHIEGIDMDVGTGYL